MLKKASNPNYKLIYLIRFFSVAILIVISIINTSLISSKYDSYNQYSDITTQQFLLLDEVLYQAHTIDDENKKKIFDSINTLKQNHLKLSSNEYYFKNKKVFRTKLNNFSEALSLHIKEQNETSFNNILVLKSNLLKKIEQNNKEIIDRNKEFIKSIIKMTLIVLIAIIIYLILESKYIITPLLKRVAKAKKKDIKFKKKLTKTFRLKTKRVKESLDIINHYVYTSETDENGIITYASDAFCELTGYKKEELIGKTHGIIKHPDTTSSTFMELWKTIKKGKVYEGQLQNIKKNGEEFWVSSLIRPIFNDQREITGYIAYRKDITHEKTLEKINDKLENMVNEKTKKLQENNELLQKLSETDSLTGIYNRKKLKESLELEIKKAKRFEDTFSIILLDIDHFKKVNDNHGHLKGDKVIIAIADLVSKNIRDIDLFARWGGEEFIILVNKQNLNQAAFIAEKLRSKIEENQIEGLNITSSFGVSQFDKNDTSESLFKRADDALYEAKEKGRNKVCTNPSLF